MTAGTGAPAGRLLERQTVRATSKLATAHGFDESGLLANRRETGKLRRWNDDRRCTHRQQRASTVAALRSRHCPPIAGSEAPAEAQGYQSWLATADTWIWGN